jgi:hypothetical protein
MSFNTITEIIVKDDQLKKQKSLEKTSFNLI